MSLGKDVIRSMVSSWAGAGTETRPPSASIREPTRFIQNVVTETEKGYFRHSVLVR